MSNIYSLNGYPTLTFTDIYGDEEKFIFDYNDTRIPQKISEESIRTVYYLLYARYGNSHIAYTDTQQFKYALFSKIFMYGPSWEKRLEVQDEIRKLDLEELTKGGKVIYNHAYNPSTAPSTSSLEELTKIDNQNTTNYKKSKLEGYAALEALLVTDVTDQFIGKFKSLFMQVMNAAPAYYFKSEVEI